MELTRMQQFILGLIEMDLPTPAFSTLVGPLIIVDQDEKEMCIINENEKQFHSGEYSTWVTRPHLASLVLDYADGWHYLMGTQRYIGERTGWTRAQKAQYELGLTEYYKKQEEAHIKLNLLD